MKILDLSAGNRAVWYRKDHPLCTYLDIRPEVEPDIVCDTRNIPKEVGSGFNLFVFDPPHMNFGANSNMSKSYGHHTTAEILNLVERTAIQSWRIAAPEALMGFKWNDHDMKLKQVLRLMPQWEPLFGHITKDGPGSKSKTYWVMLKRIDPP